MRLSRLPFVRSIAAVGMAAVLSYLPLTAQAQTGHDPQTGTAGTQADTAQLHKQAKSETSALIALQKRWDTARGAEKDSLATQMVAKAEQRRAVLLKLMQSSPAAVLQAAIPEQNQTGMPQEVSQKLEQKLNTEGKLTLLQVENFKDPAKSHMRYELTTTSGERFDLHLSGKRMNLRSGDQVQVSGVLIPSDTGSSSGDVALNTDTGGLNLAYAGSTSTSSTTVLPTNTFGEQHTLVILVNFQDDTSQPYTVASAKSTLFTDVNNFYQENSFGQAWLTGDVAGWYTIPVSSTTCDVTTIANEAKTAAANHGIDLSAYSRFVYGFPTNACGFSGTATVGDSPSQVWINGPFDFDVVAHELGHNFGLQHSHSLNCTDGSIIGAGNPTVGYGVDPYPNCSNLEYGDGLDVMGWSPSAEFNSYQKEILGWLNYGNSPPIQTVDTSGQYTIYPYAAQDGNTKALKVLKSVDPTTGERTWYYIEFRQPIGFDSTIADSYMNGNMLNTSNVLNGVIIHAKYEVGGNMGYLLDMTPSTSELYSTDPALDAGKTFVSPDGDLTITTVSTDSSKAVVDIEFTGSGSSSSGSGSGSTTTPTCTHANPTLSLSPGQSSSVAAGTAYTYTVTLTNNDNSACSTSTFSLAATKPSGWSAALGSSSLSLSPGTSASTSLTVTSASTAVDGLYTIGVNATSGSYSASGSVVYAVSNPVTSTNSAPVAVNDSASTSAGTPVTIAVLANDSDPDGDVLTVTGVTQGSKGSVKLNSDGTVTFTPAKNFKNSDSFSYTISDGTLSASATVSVTLSSSSTTTSGGSGKGNGKGPGK